MRWPTLNDQLQNFKWAEEKMMSHGSKISRTVVADAKAEDRYKERVWSKEISW